MRIAALVVVAAALGMSAVQLHASEARPYTGTITSITVQNAYSPVLIDHLGRRDSVGVGGVQVSSIKGWGRNTDWNDEEVPLVLFTFFGDPEWPVRLRWVESIPDRAVEVHVQRTDGGKMTCEGGGDCAPRPTGRVRVVEIRRVRERSGGCAFSVRVMK